MSPTNKKKLNLLRVKLDRLDNNLLKLIKKRSSLVNKVLKVKTHKKEIIDQKRINFILKKIKKKSIQSNIDPKITNSKNPKIKTFFSGNFNFSPSPLKSNSFGKPLR